MLHHFVKFSRDLSGYVAGGLTQPSAKIRVTDTGIKPWQSLSQSTENKIYTNRVGWDKRSVPNMFFPEAKPFNFPKERILNRSECLKKLPIRGRRKAECRPQRIWRFRFWVHDETGACISWIRNNGRHERPDRHTPMDLSGP